jgi:N-acyl-D-amino-acid deacylase
MKLRHWPFALSVALAGCVSTPTPVAEYDLVVRGGSVYDGTGGAPMRADVAIDGDRIVRVGDLSDARARRTIDATGFAVAPGFINTLSWATESLLVDGRAESDVRQGVTLEVFGEGWSYGPWNDAMKAEAKAEQSDIRYEITWTTLGEYLDHMAAGGISPNIASFVGATTVRQFVLGNANRAPTPDELVHMQTLVREAMAQGALGVGSSLIYAPASYADTAELIALVKAAAESGGAYTSHLRSEGDRFLEALDELIAIARATGAHVQVYHLKAAGERNWPKMADAIARIGQARAEGLSISANMYSYTAGATGLYACMDPAVQEGGLDVWIARLREPATRARVVDEMRKPGVGWENLCEAAGSADRIVLLGFSTEALKPLTGRTLADVASERGTSPWATVVDLIVADHSRIDAAFFLMSEENVRLGLSQPWVALGSDEAAYAPEGVFLKRQPHPRSYGTFTRFLADYVRDGGVAPLADAVRRLTDLPAREFKLVDRGRIAAGYYADLVVFDPAALAAPATFAQPQQYARGMREVIVNGVVVLAGGEHTGATPGRVVRGPGWRGD